MSLFGLMNEYLQMMKAGMENPKAVIEGVVNSVKSKYGHLPEAEQTEIARRRLICSQCPYTSSNAVSNPALNYHTDRLDEHCWACKCPIETKTAALTQNCGLEVYNRKTKQNIPLKWEVYIPKS